MHYHIKIQPRIFHFKQPARTSRGIYYERYSWFIDISSPDYPSLKHGVGECAPLPDLSCDAFPENYEQRLKELCKQVTPYLGITGIDYSIFEPYPSMLFGLETALLHFKRQSSALYDTSFSHEKAGIPINGLIWMDDYDKMKKSIEEKLKNGFSCIKLKIGAIHFEDELNLIQKIRQSFSKKYVEIRIDANGAFTYSDALSKIGQLSIYDIHSIEQPIPAKQWDQMKKLCSETPIPIALDEDLIGINTLQEKSELLNYIHPHYIVLKPSLHGGMHGGEEWIRLAKQKNIGYWITSALESNVGLNAIAQWTAHIHKNPITFPQGLGTGQLFTDNIPSPLYIQKNTLWYKKDMTNFRNR